MSDLFARRYFVPYDVQIRSPDTNEIAWAAGLFIGEGNVGQSWSRGADKYGPKFHYLNMQMVMNDRRAIARFAKIFGVKSYKVYIKLRGYYAYRIAVRGRTAERVLALMWPHLKGTDKGDQTARYARKLRVFPWITGERVGLRPQLRRHKRGIRSK